MTQAAAWAGTAGIITAKTITKDKTRRANRLWICLLKLLILLKLAIMSPSYQQLLSLNQTQSKLSTIHKDRPSTLEQPVFWLNYKIFLSF